MKKSFNIVDKRDIAEKAKKLKMQEATEKSIMKLDLEPTKKNLDIALETIDTDNIITTEEKGVLIDSLREKYISLFNFENIPDDYNDLKREAKFLSTMTSYSFLLMAQRLMKIRDLQLYKQDNYADFKSFVEGELTINRQTAYKYIDIVNYFDVSSMRHEQFDYSKLIPFIPIMKADNNEIPKEELKIKIIDESKIKSQREMTVEATEMKIKYGIMKKGRKIELVDQIKKLANNLSNVEIEELIEYLKSRK